MSTRWSEADLNAVRSKLHGRPPAHKRSKYGNQRVRFQGQVFDSKHELEQWKALELQRVAGAIRAVIRQVSIPLPQTVRRIRVDFVVIDNQGNFRFYDAKGFDNPIGKLKRQQIFDAYGICIELL